jgi:V8-like Glu-specific endopeptidase
MPATTVQVASATISFFTKISLIGDSRMATAAHCIRHRARGERVTPGTRIKDLSPAALRICHPLH